MYHVADVPQELPQALPQLLPPYVFWPRKQRLTLQQRYQLLRYWLLLDYIMMTNDHGARAYSFGVKARTLAVMKIWEPGGSKSCSKLASKLVATATT